ncbi:MAG: DNA polymerase subunit beta [Elusimicrobia bacterium RIFCSPLOWO2_12_FULL_39_28]|nr:MAG: DNA polymerase subunit beta [Elusimicrobia bacterium RIFCSPLOWO2_12_FULL_39_28]
MPTQESIKVMRNEILKIAAHHGAKNLRIFGSVVRGDAKPTSDIDFLVEVDKNHSPFFPGGFVADLEELLGCKIDIVTEKSLHWYIRDRVIHEAIPL